MSGMILAGVGSVIGAGTAIAGTVMSGSGQGGQDPNLQLAIEDYNRRYKEWDEYWEKRFPSMTANQKKTYKRTQKLLNSYKGKFASNFDEKSMERVHREFVGEVNQLSMDVYADLTGKSRGVYDDIKGKSQGIYSDITGKSTNLYNELKADAEQLRRGELDPAFAQRMREAEHEMNRDTSDDLNMLVNRHARERAKGGMGFLNPERRDEMISQAMTRSRDSARSSARKQIEDTLAMILSQKTQMGNNYIGQQSQAGNSFMGQQMGAGSDYLGQQFTAAQNLMQSKHGLLDDYFGLGQQQRSRETDQLKSNFGFDSMAARNAAAQRGFWDQLQEQKFNSRPQMQIPGISRDQGSNTGQQVADVGGTVASLLAQFGGMYGMQQQPQQQSGRYQPQFDGNLWFA